MMNETIGKIYTAKYYYDGLQSPFAVGIVPVGTIVKTKYEVIDPAKGTIKSKFRYFEVLTIPAIFTDECLIKEVELADGAIESPFMYFEDRSQSA